MDFRDSKSPFPRDNSTSLTMATLKGRVLSFLQPLGRHFLKCSPVSIWADTLYTLRASLEGCIKPLTHSLRITGADEMGTSELRMFFTFLVPVTVKNSGYNMDFRYNRLVKRNVCRSCTKDYALGGIRKFVSGIPVRRITHDR